MLIGIFVDGKCVLKGERPSLSAKFNNLTGINFPNDPDAVRKYRRNLGLDALGDPDLFSDGVTIELTGLNAGTVFGCCTLGVTEAERITAERMVGRRGGFANLYRRFPKPIAEKYSRFDPQDALGWKVDGFRYVGPRVSTSVCALGHFRCEVFDEDTGELLKVCESDKRKVAFNEGSQFAENRGFPWKAGKDPEIEVFDPISGRMWSYVPY